MSGQYEKHPCEVNLLHRKHAKSLLHATAHVFNKQVLKVYRLTSWFIVGQLAKLWKGSFPYTSVTDGR